TNLHKKIAEGVYLSVVHSLQFTVYGKDWLPALTFIGSAKTFGKKDYKAETWIMDFDGNLYGKFLTIKLIKKVRGNIKFESAKSLIYQMKKDEKEARDYFRLHKA
ncbi:MAG TPA: riboflavin kinase, partial [Patescibacteria group bacterium]